MPRLLTNTGMACLVVVLAVPLSADAGGSMQGRLYDPGGGWKELFVWGSRTGEGKVVGNFTDMGGFFGMPGLEPGVWTFGFSRRFGLGPVILPGVTVEEGRTAYVLMLQSWPYDVREAKGKVEGHRAYALGFVARAECVRRAYVDADVPKGTEMVYMVREGKPDGKQIGPQSTGQWEPGQVRLERGQTYFLTILRKDEQLFGVMTAKPEKARPAFADGKKLDGASIGGRIVTDRTGIMVDNFTAEGELYGPCVESFHQTFVARGTGLAMMDFIPSVGGGRREGTRYAVRILEGGPGGKQIGPTKISSGSDMMPGAAIGFELRAVLYNRDEVRFTPGRKYCVEFTGDPKSFRIATHKGTLMGGEFLKDGQPVADRCLDTTVIEYEPDNSPPPPAENLRADLAGTAVQLAFDVPTDMDVNSALITRSAGGKAEELAKFYSCPGRMGLYVDRRAEPNQTYQYSVMLVDAAGNRSGPVTTQVRVKPITPESNLLINGDFVASKSASGGLCPGWDTASLAHGASWSVVSPKKEGEGYAISAWQKWSTYDVVAFQRVPVTRGMTYVFSAMTNRKDPFNNGDVNEVTLIGIDPVGGSNAAADSVVWSAAEYQSNKWLSQTVKAVAQSDTITVYLRARSLHTGLGMEGLFSKATLRMLGAAAAGGTK